MNTMVFSRVPTECNMVIDGEKVKNVKETVYLVVKLGEDGKMEGEVERRIGMTVHACGTCPIAAIWLPRATNFSFVFSLVSPAGFVGSEQD